MGTETLARHSPLGPVAVELQRVCSSAKFSCREDAFRVLAEVRCGESSISHAADVIGGELPAIGAFSTLGASYVIGLGPRWWMLDGSDGSAPTGSSHVSVVDVSAQRTPFVLHGTSVRDVLAHGTTLDVHPRHFPIGAAAQSLLAKAGVVLARTADDEYRVWVRSSFARYMAAWLMDASVEYR